MAGRVLEGTPEQACLTWFRLRRSPTMVCTRVSLLCLTSSTVT